MHLVRPLLREKGAGKTGCLQLHPRALAQQKVREREDHRYRQEHAGLPCAVVCTAASCSPQRTATCFVTVASPTPLEHLRSLTARLGTARTTRLDRTLNAPKRHRRISRPTALRLTQVTMHAPLLTEAGCTLYTSNPNFGQPEIFIRVRLDTASCERPRRANQLYTHERGSRAIDRASHRLPCRRDLALNPPTWLLSETPRSVRAPSRQGW